jgi:hypothetical protein
MFVLSTLIISLCTITTVQFGPTITLDQLQEFAKAIAPIVEKHAERRFKEAPPIRIVDAKEMEELLIDDIDHVLKLLKIDIVENLDMGLALMNMVSTVVPTLAGKYVLHKKEIVIAPAAIEALAVKNSWTPDRKAALVKLVLAHELVHALSDQVVGYDRAIANVADSELKKKIFGPVNEGLACVLTRRMAGDLGIAAEFDELEKTYMDNPLFGKEYKTGQSIMQKVLDKFGVAGLWANFENPIDADRSGTKSDNANRYKKLLQAEAVTRIMTCGAPEYMELPPDLGMQFFKLLDPLVITGLKKGLNRVYSMGCVKREDPARAQLVSVTIYAANDSISAKELYENHRAAIDKLFEKLKSAMPIQTRWVQTGAQDAGSDLQWWRIQTKDFPMDQYFAWTFVDREVIQIMTLNATPSDSDFKAAFEFLEDGLRNSN